MNGAGLYVHIPYCSSICPYCDFAVTRGSTADRRIFVDALTDEIRLRADAIRRSPLHSSPAIRFDTIFFGGGTPSSLTESQLERILDQLKRQLPVVESPWIAMEVNPEDVTVDRLSYWRDLDISYLSLGIQSFDQQSLSFLGRRHSSSQARQAVLWSKDSGIPTVSIDLIYSLPDQTVSAWEQELRTAMGLAPDHLSCYQLTLEPNTPFGALQRRGRLHEVPQERQASLFFTTHRRLAEFGFQAYEISNFSARIEHRSKHNQKYWNHSEYLGFGPSAHSYQNGLRSWNQADVRSYVETVKQGRPPLAGDERIGPEQTCLEMVALGLRRPSGILLAKLPRGIGSDILARNRGLLQQWVDRDLVTFDSERIRPTLRGMAIADALARDLVIPGSE